MPHAYFLEGKGGAKRRSCRPNGGAYVRLSPCRTPSVRPPTSDCRPQGGHPCIERTRDAHGRSNVLRPLQRRFKAQKKPEGYTSTPAGLKRLKTQITAFRVNENGKGTPSGVPQPIHKRKLILRSFMGRNQFKKVRSRPLKKSEAEEVRQGKGVPFRRALHTFGTPCTLRCTPFFIEVCRLFFLFSLVYEPFPMLSRRPARHAHHFFNDYIYVREFI